MDIKIIALEVARLHATDTDDLLKKAAKIEAYLSNGMQTAPQPIGEKITHPDAILPIVEEAPMPLTSVESPAIRLNLKNGDPLIEQLIKDEFGIDIGDDFVYETPKFVTEMTDDARALDREFNEADDLIKMAKGLTANLEELGYNIDPEKSKWQENASRVRLENEIRLYARMKKEVALLESCSDFFTAPVEEPNDYLEERNIDNYRIDKALDPLGLMGDNIPLSDMQLTIAKYMEEGDLILNTHRQFGTTTLLAAFARQEAALGKKILIMTNTIKACIHMGILVDDGSVSIYDFNTIADRKHAGEFYDHIIIDMAAFIPYAIEDQIKTYVEDCTKASLEDQNAKYNHHLPTLPRFIIASVPGQARGWFYEEFTFNLTKRRLAVPWQKGFQNIDLIKLDPKTFANQYENKFRPVSDK